MRGCSTPIGALLPHAPPAILLDRVASWEDRKIAAEVTIRPGLPFFQDGLGVPAHVGLEYMAQSCGAFAGLHGRAAGEAPSVGFLLGTRDYRAALAWFVPGMALTIEAEQIYNQDGMGCFACAIRESGAVIASAQLNVFQPPKAFVL